MTLLQTNIMLFSKRNSSRLIQYFVFVENNVIIQFSKILVGIFFFIYKPFKIVKNMINKNRYYKTLRNHMF